MSIIKAIKSVITTACTVIVRVMSALERNANALDELSKASEIKARNFVKQVTADDEHAFNKRMAKINRKRVAAGMEAVDATSAQAAKAKKSKDQVDAAQATLDI